MSAHDDHQPDDPLSLVEEDVTPQDWGTEDVAELLTDVIAEGWLPGGRDEAA